MRERERELYVLECIVSLSLFFFFFLVFWAVIFCNLSLGVRISVFFLRQKEKEKKIVVPYKCLAGKVAGSVITVTYHTPSYMCAFLLHLLHL